MWWQAVLWYLISSAAGLAVFPLVFAIFPALADRGYTVSRAIGLLIWGYLFWLFSSLRVLPNTSGGILAAFLLVAAISLWVWRRAGSQNLMAWLKEHRRMVVAVEALFLAAFAFLLLLRGMEPAVLGTEKPMELAFINAILRSPFMPPNDPWLADYAISYYYFGYVIVAMLAKTAGTSGGVAFNLGLSLVFALGAVGAYGMIHNLLAARKPANGTAPAGVPLLGPLFVLIVSNVEGFLEFLHGRGVFWSQTADGQWRSAFWSWVNLDNLKLPPPGNTAPGELRHWWWWRASRVVADFDLFGNFREVIDEFPFFSFFLGDLHPHVLVIPFVFAALAVSLNFFLRKEEVKDPIGLFGLRFLVSWRDILLGAFIFGSLGFLNLWDFPWYVVVFAGAHLLKQSRQEGWAWQRVLEAGVLVILFGIAGVVLFLPFYLSFSSQAGGIVPNVINPTRGIHLWIMFGTLFVPLFAFLGAKAFRKGRTAVLRGMGLAALVLLGLLGFSLLFSAMIGPEVRQAFFGVPDLASVLGEGLSRRGAAVFSALTLLSLLGLGLAALWPDPGSGEAAELDAEDAKPDRFAALLAVVATLLVLTPEFFFLQDLFSSRMNTVFKFYYQAWMLWALAAAYGSAVLISQRGRRLAGWLYPALFVIVLTVGLTYPVMALNTRIVNFSSQAAPALELDGTANFFYLSPDEHAAVDWLKQAPLGTLVEVVHPGGGSYTHFARISMNSGQPALLGWVGHEQQWRGGGDEIGSRQADIEVLYTTPDWQTAASLIEQYQVVYIVIGNLERSTYLVQEAKFTRNLEPVFQLGTITIYQTALLDN
jgi:YYY domain-containing protein